MNNTLLAGISVAFIRRFRVTLLIFFGILLVGAFTYTSLLKREGFPAIEVPTAVIQATYFVNDTAAVDEQVTAPIETVLRENESVEQVRSTTDANFAVFVVQFRDGISSEDGVDSVRGDIAERLQLPAEATLGYTTFNASSVDGENDMLFNLYGDDEQALYAAAQQAVSGLNRLSVVGEASVIDQYREQINPLTGEPVTLQVSFNRVGVREREGLTFYPAVSVGVIKKSDAIGTVELSEAVREEIKQQQDTDLFEGIEVTYGGDLADVLTSQIGSLESNVLSGLLAVVVVLFFFVNWRASIVTAIFIPTVLAATFIALLLVGYSLNVLSLFAIILVLGLFVDDAIVVVEAIDYQKKQGKQGVAAVRDAVRAVGAADISGTVTTLLVFLPMAAISGILGDFIRLIPITVIIALALSLVIALTIVPLLSHILLTGEHKDTTFPEKMLHTVFYGFSDLIQGAGRLMSEFVRLYLSVPLLGAGIVVLALAAVFVGGSFAGQLKFSIFPAPDDTDQISVSISFPEGQRLLMPRILRLRSNRSLQKKQERRLCPSITLERTALLRL
ncbi:MAG: Toluene efflux pump membrane transporter TtgE [candidate division WS6 bacterium OLB20]|uniref:Toluene efflux pump membrane transporter TtgE n=1 Tax=candidate division WS6 bacterium OLB20 TaxID=1617426 RepID=A0A136M085_9BACT|nr:MAG: Toluene efflux pump membrane transporter TtgE [candidate division WS6 bacterium OLB20]